MFWCQNWLIGFLVGSTLGLNLDWPALWDGTGVCLCFVLSAWALWCHDHPNQFKILTFLVGFLWALCHSAPTPKDFIQSPEIFHANIWGASDLGAIIRKDAKAYHARGYAQEGARGYLRERSVDFFRKKEFDFKPYDIRATDAHLVAKFAFRVQSYFHDLVYKIPGTTPAFRSWLEGIYFGKPIREQDIMGEFRLTGLLHLLVVSGMHIVFIAWILDFVLGLPVHIFYILGSLSPGSWVLFQGLKFLCTSLFLFLYLVGIGLPQAGQRAFFVFVLLRWKRLVGLVWTSEKALVASAVAQALMFPMGFLNTSNLLSWGIYFLIIGQFLELSRIDGFCKEKFFKIIQHQFEIFILSSVVIGKGSLFGVFANLILVPVFTFVFFVGVLFFLPNLESHWVCSVAKSIHFSFLDFVSICARWAEFMPGNFVDLKSLPWVAQVFLVFVAGYVVLMRLSTAQNQTKP